MRCQVLTAAVTVSALSLTACATVPADGQERAPADTCRAEPGQRFIGQRATAEIGAAIMSATDSARLRWVPPDTAVTMEYGLGRVTVSYDRDYGITAVSCS